MIGALGGVRDPALVREALPALLLERRETIALLREVEWRGSDTGVSEYGGECPCCGANGPCITVESPPRLVTPAEPHRPGCRLKALIGG